MAFVDPNAQNQQQPTTTGQQAPIASGGAGVAGGATKQAASTPGVNTPAQPSAQLSAYLSANQPQATAFAGNIAGTLGAQTKAAGDAIQPAVNAYTGNLYTVPTDSTVNSQVSTAPSKLSQDKTATFQKELGASAAAPNAAGTFETTAPYQNISGGIQKAVEQANLWNSGNNVPNLSTALSPFEANGETSGNTTLDALLLSQTPGAYNQITQAVAPAAVLQGQLTQGTSQADAALQSAIAQDNAATAAATAAPQTYANNLTSYLTNAVNSATQNDTAQNAKIMSDLSNNTPTPDELSLLGVTPDQWAALSNEITTASAGLSNLGYGAKAIPGTNINLSQYLTQTAPNITAANLATPEQYADVAAIASILGGNAPVEPISASTANEASTAPGLADLNKFNLTGAEADAQIAPLQQQAQALEEIGTILNQQWGVNHAGGQSPDQFNAQIAGMNAQLKDINDKIAALKANSPQFQGVSGVSGSNSSGPNIGNIVGGAISPIGYLTGAPLIGPIGSVANDIGGFFGI